MPDAAAFKGSNNILDNGFTLAGPLDIPNVGSSVGISLGGAFAASTARCFAASCAASTYIFVCFLRRSSSSSLTNCFFSFSGLANATIPPGAKLNISESTGALAIPESASGCACGCVIPWGTGICAWLACCCICCAAWRCCPACNAASPAAC